MKYYCFYICCLFFRSLLGKSWWYLYTVKDSQEKLSSPFSLSLCHTQTCMVLAVQCLSENNSSLTTSSLMVAQSNQRYSGCSKSGLSFSVPYFSSFSTSSLLPVHQVHLSCCFCFLLLMTSVHAVI